MRPHFSGRIIDHNHLRRTNKANLMLLEFIRRELNTQCGRTHGINLTHAIVIKKHLHSPRVDSDIVSLDDAIESGGRQADGFWRRVGAELIGHAVDPHLDTLTHVHDSHAASVKRDLFARVAHLSHAFLVHVDVFAARVAQYLVVVVVDV